MIRWPVALAALFALAGQARAERTVAFVNLAEDATETGDAIAKLRGALEDNPEWRATETDYRIEGALPDEPGLDPALLDGVREAYRKVDTKSALEQLAAIEKSLLPRRPTEDVFEALAQAAFLRGKVLAAADRPDDAVTAFTLAYRLRPNSDELDPKRFPPKVRALYEMAVAQGDGKRKPIEISSRPSNAAVWINGALAGRTPLEVNVAPGAHYVTVHRAGRTASTVVYEGGDKKLTIQLHDLTEDAEIVSLRAALVGPVDLVALEDLARKLGVGRVVLLRARGKGAEAATYETGSDKLGAWGGASADRLFPIAAGAQNLGDVGRRAEPKKWYQKTWGKVAIVGGTLIGGLLIYGIVASGSEDDVSRHQIGGFEWVP